MKHGLSGEVFVLSQEWGLTSGENTITEGLIQDGVEIFTTYRDSIDELEVINYCALGSEPGFKLASLPWTVLELELDESKNGPNSDQETFVNRINWTKDGKNPPD